MQAVRTARAKSVQPLRLRSTRHGPEELEARRLTVTLSHPGLGQLQAQVENLSLHGAALVLPGRGKDAAAVLPGDRIDSLVVRYDGPTLYDGPATVRRAHPEGEDLRLGVELEAAVDLAQVYRNGALRSVTSRWQALRARAQPQALLPEFKAWVADAHAYLTQVRTFLDAEERLLHSEDRLTREEAHRAWLEVIVPQLVSDLDGACVRLERMLLGLSLEEQATYRAYLHGQLRPFFLAAPFMRRALEKPLGYAGDYEMMNMIYLAGPEAMEPVLEGESLFGRALNVFSLRLAAARANYNRLEYLGRLIRQVVEGSDLHRVRIASIGCGPANEVAALLERFPELGGRLELTLVDQEERALNYCERTLGPLAARTGMKCHFVRESVRRLLTSGGLSTALGSQELVYSAGLFDYFNDRAFQALLGALYDALSAQGTLAVGNISDTNPSRTPMEYFADWFLHGRSRAQLERLAQGLEPSPRIVWTEAEPLEVNLFLRVSR